MRIATLSAFILLCFVPACALSINSFHYVGQEETHHMKQLSEDYPPLPAQLVGQINTLNVAAMVNSHIGNLYVSHGCIHVAPVNSYILYSVLPLRTQVTIRPYGITPPASALKLPDLSELVSQPDDLSRLTQQCAQQQGVRLEIYPEHLGILYINKNPVACFDVLSGPAYPNTPLEQIKDGELIFDKNKATPTPTGEHAIYQKTDFFYAPLYPHTSLIPQGALLARHDGRWQYQTKQGDWETLPDPIVEDITRTSGDHELIYYDIKRAPDNSIESARWGAHPFGSYSMILMTASGVITSVLIHTNGELMLEEQELLYYLSDIVTAPESSWEEYVQRHPVLGEMKVIHDFIRNPNDSSYAANMTLAFYKFTNFLLLSAAEKQLVPDIYVVARRAVQCKRENRSFTPTAQEKDILRKWGLPDDNNLMSRLIGVYADALGYEVSLGKAAQWYSFLQSSWSRLAPLRSQFAQYFDRHGIADRLEQQQICHLLLATRLNLRPVTSLQLWEPVRGLLK